jgi:DNA-binding MarR family transcriptional regulator
VLDSDLITNWGLVVEAYSAVTRRLGDDIAQSMPMPWFEVLLRLVRTPGHRLPMTSLAQEVSFSSGGFTKLADRIVEAGYAERVACEADRRVTWITLTPAGVEIVEAALKRHTALLRELVVAPLGDDKVNELGTIMRALRDATP